MTNECKQGVPPELEKVLPSAIVAQLKAIHEDISLRHEAIDNPVVSRL